MTADRSAEMLALLDVAVAQSSESILITDAMLDPPGPRIVFVNPAFTRLTGYSASEVIGKTPRVLQGPGTDSAVIQRLRRCLERGVGFEGEALQYRKDGSEYRQEWRITPVRLADDRITHFVAFLRDVTARWQEAGRLRTSEQAQRQPTGTLAAEKAGLLTAPRVAPVGSWETDLRSREMAWSEETHRIFETDPAAFRPTHERFLQRVHPEDRNAVNRAFRESFRGRQGVAIEHRLLFDDGRIKTVDLRWQITADQDGAPLRVIGTCQDVSERKRTELALRDTGLKYQRLNRVHTVLSEINELIVRVTNRDELMRDVCRIAVEHGGFRMAMICLEGDGDGRMLPVASAGKDRRLMKAIAELLGSEENAPDTLVHWVMRHRTPHVANDLALDEKSLLRDLYAVEGVRSLAVLPLFLEGRAVGVIALYAADLDFFQVDVMKLLTNLAADIAFAVSYIAKQERLDYLANYDSLTGLPRRSLFVERASRCVDAAQAQGQKLALFLFDIEHFKNINDTLGLAAGDGLLKQIAQWLLQAAKDPELVAHLGADHFAVVMTGVRPDGDLRRPFDHTMGQFLDHAFTVGEHLLRIAARAGVAVYPDDGDDIESLLRNAETALKKAKSTGDRVMFFDHSMSERVAAELMLENELRQALANDEFVLHYQPKIRLNGGEVVGAEALIRWNSPMRGLQAPDTFIPMLERTGLINAVGRWVIETAIRDHLRWCDAGYRPLRLAVNVSALQLRSRGFVTALAQQVLVDARAPAGLELEITESMVMENVQHGIESLERIRALGVHCTMDDFGTGYSSLSYLWKLPLDTIKIDRSFVRELADRGAGAAIIGNIISLAHSLGLNVVAEGVETQAQSQILKRLACDEIQGFLISPGVTREVFEARFLTRDDGGRA